MEELRYLFFVSSRLRGKIDIFKFVLKTHTLEKRKIHRYYAGRS